MAQPSLFPDLPEPAVRLPGGFDYRPELIDAGEEAALAGELAALDLKPFEFHGHLGLRRIKAFGGRYNYDRSQLEAADALPGFLLSLREKAAAFAGRPADDFAQALVTEYAAGAPIGWHRDKPQFGEIVGVSLLSPCLFRLRRRESATWRRASQVLAPRSAYRMTGETRHVWEHSIPPVAALRYSITFRTLATAAGEHA